MKISIKKFVIGFVLGAHAFQFATNSLLGQSVSMYPKDGNWYPGLNSEVIWEKSLSHLIYPIKYVLIEPLSFLAKDPDFVPPMLLISFTVYWAVMAIIAYFLFSRIFSKKRKISSPNE